MSDLVFNPEYRFPHAVVIKSILYTCTLIHNPRLFILCNVLAQNMNISSHCTIGKHAYGTCLNGFAHFSSVFLCAINVAILGNSKSKL